MNFFEKTLKTPSIPTSNKEVKEFWDRIDQKHVDADKKIEIINKLMKKGFTQEESFNQVVKKQ